MRRAERRSFSDRLRPFLLPIFALAGIALLGAFFLTSATRSAYTCREQLQPGASEPIGTAVPTAPVSPSESPSASASPSPSASPSASASASGGPSPSAEPSPSASPTPVPSPTQRLGFATRDLGREHTPAGRTLEYEYCPPASGPHYNQAGNAALRRQFYGQEREINPGNWVHNLEHGYVVALYSCAGGCPSADQLARVEQFFDTAPRTEGAATCGVDNKVIAGRFDGMSRKFALVAWDRVLLLDDFDLQAALTFTQQYGDRPAPFIPEPGAC